MNYIIYNDDLIAENNFIINPSNRAFCYGDGLFETLILKNGKLLFLEDHINRLSEGLQLLDIELPKIVSAEALLEKTILLAHKNNLSSNARVKLQVWRKEGGLVTPESTDANYTITVSELKKPIEVKKDAYVSENIKLHFGNLSKFKTLNFLPYIQAGIEKKKRNVDEIILTDSKGNISEASSSNIFWVKSDCLFTPSLEAGCIDGIMRKQIIKFCKQESIKITIGLFPASELINSELLFTSNVNGLSIIENVNNSKINTQYTIYQAIRISMDLI